MNADVIALREHLVAEALYKRSDALDAQRIAFRLASLARMEWDTQPTDGWLRQTQRNAEVYAQRARTATDAWLASDARLRALDGLLAASKAQEDAVELRRTGTFARGRWHTREEIDALMLVPCEGDACDSVRYFSRECLPCGLRRLGPR